ncbi:RHS repeat protein, partial [Acinetobacter sp. 187]|nr:RHS repeat protein [Acinetobacter lanii]
MTFQDVNNASASGASSVGETEQDVVEQPVEVAVFNLESTRSPTDLQMMANQIQRFLHDCGDTNLSNLQPSAAVPMVANSFALTGSVLDLILYALHPKKGELGVQQVAMLSANLIGLFFAPPAEAHVRMALRPMLGLMAECLYREGGQIREGDIKRLSLHLNARIAGDLELFLKETKGKLGGLLSSASALGTQILTTLALPKPNISTVLTASTIAAGGGGASADKRDPKEQFTNWASPLASLLATPSLADIKPVFPMIPGMNLQAKASIAL